MNEPGVRSVLSPEELQELEEWFAEQDRNGGLNGEPAVKNTDTPVIWICSNKELVSASS